MNKNNACLVIGIANYHSIGGLPQAVENDASDIYSVLTNSEYCSYPEENAQLLINDAATGNNIRSAFEQLANQTNPESTVFIYASCHGANIASEPYQGSYLLPVDVRYDNSSDEMLAQTSISTDEFTQILRQLEVKQLIVMLDCCHSGGLGQAKSINNSMAKNGLSDADLEMMKGRGRVIFASSRESEVSIVFSNARNSVFTTHVLSGLKGNASGLDGYIRVFGLFDYIQPQIKNDVDNQHPLFKSEVENNIAIAYHENYKKIAKDIIENSDDDFKYDVYISFFENDTSYPWINDYFFPLLKEKEVKFVTSIDRSTAPLGGYQVVSMNEGIKQSRRTLLLISNDYLNNFVNTTENAMAQHMGIEEGSYRVIPLYYKEPVDKSLLPTRLSMLNGVDLNHKYRAKKELERLLLALKSPLPKF